MGFIFLGFAYVVGMIRGYTLGACLVVAGISIDILGFEFLSDEAIGWCGRILVIIGLIALRHAVYDTREKRYLRRMREKEQLQQTDRR